MLIQSSHFCNLCIFSLGRSHGGKGMCRGCETSRAIKLCARGTNKHQLPGFSGSPHPGVAHCSGNYSRRLSVKHTVWLPRGDKGSTASLLFLPSKRQSAAHVPHRFVCGTATLRKRGRTQGRRSYNRRLKCFWRKNTCGRVVTRPCATNTAVSSPRKSLPHSTGRIVSSTIAKLAGVLGLSGH